MIRAATFRRRRWLRSWGASKARSQETTEIDGIKTPCRICHSPEESLDDPLVAPCLCDGSLRYVHPSCQKIWLRTRRGASDYTCELCHTELTCRLNAATCAEVAGIYFSSAVVWSVQAASALQALWLGVQLAASSWQRRGGTGLAARRNNVLLTLLSNLLTLETERLLPAPEVERVAVQHLVVAFAVVLLACVVLRAFGRALVLVGEEALDRVCAIKIGGCVLMLLHELLCALPPTRMSASVLIWHALGATLVLDTLLLAFLRVPREEREALGKMGVCVARTACRLSSGYLPFAAVVMLWAIAAIMIMVFSVMPCAMLVLHEAFKNVRRRRWRHGCIQITILLLRVAAYAGTASSSTIGHAISDSRCNRALDMIWFAIEVAILMDLGVLRWGACSGRDMSSQVMWAAAIVGEAALAAYRRPCAWSIVSATARRNFAGGRGYAARLPSPGGADPESVADASLSLQDSALAFGFICFVVIHRPFFGAWLRHASQVVRSIFPRFEPGQMVFYDHPRHRNRCRLDQ